MKIKLTYFLSKNKLTLAEFCNINGIKSYNCLTEYCTHRKLIPITQKEYKESFPIKKQNNEPKTKVKQTAKPKRRYTRKKSKKQ
jgi:hypothetical protein